MKKEQNSVSQGLVITVIIIATALVILGGFIIGLSGPDPYVYGDYTFEYKNGFYYVELNSVYGPQEVPFYHHPSTIDHIPYNSTANSLLRLAQIRGQELKIGLDANYSTDGNMGIAGVEVSKVTSRVLGIQTRSGFTDQIEGFAIYNCELSSPENIVIELRVADQTRIYTQDFCIILEGQTPRELTRVANLLAYRSLGIIR